MPASTTYLPLYEINRAGHAALVRELGVVDAIRFLNQYTPGRGDYTAERHSFLTDPPLDELFEQARRLDEENEV